MSAKPFLEGSFPVDSDPCQIGSIQIRQDQQTLQVWFSRGHNLPRNHWKREDLAGMTVYYSSHMARAYGGEADVPVVAGIVCSWPEGPSTLYPVRTLHVAIEDFK